jgi:hypothetical protein
MADLSDLGYHLVFTKTRCTISHPQRQGFRIEIQRGTDRLFTLSEFQLLSLLKFARLQCSASNVSATARPTSTNSVFAFGEIPIINQSSDSVILRLDDSRNTISGNCESVFDSDMPTGISPEILDVENELFGFDENAHNELNVDNDDSSGNKKQSQSSIKKLRRRKKKSQRNLKLVPEIVSSNDRVAQNLDSSITNQISPLLEGVVEEEEVQQHQRLKDVVLRKNGRGKVTPDGNRPAASTISRYGGSSGQSDSSSSESGSSQLWSSAGGTSKR